MRSILGIALLLLGVGLASCHIEGSSADMTVSLRESDWVRTVDGWERPHSWLTARSSPPALHPLVLASGQVLLSAFALAASTRTLDRV